MHKQTVVDQIEILRDGTIQVRIAKEVVDDDGVVLSKEWHRTSFDPGQDIDTQMEAVNQHLVELKYPAVASPNIVRIKVAADAFWTPEVLSEREAKRPEEVATLEKRMDSHQAPSSVRAVLLSQVKAALLAAFVVLNVSYFCWIFGSIEGAVYCCDAATNVWGARTLLAEGLLFESGVDGYRSVHNFAVVAVVTALGGGSYALGALLIYAVSGAALLLAFGGRQGFVPIFSAFFLNPVALANVPVPTQESQMVLLLGPLIVTSWLALRERRERTAIMLLFALAATAWMIKGSLLLVALPVVALACRIAWQRRTLWPSLVGFALFAAVVAPQSYVAVEKFGTLNPYPTTRVLADQIVWGYSAWRYETVVDDGTKNSAHGVFSPTPFDPIAKPADYIDRMLTAPQEVVALWVGHTLAAFDYSQIKTYITDPRRAFSLFNVLVGATLCLGLLQWFKVLGSGYRREDFLVDSVLLGSAALLPLLAVETRFSLLAALVITFRAFQWFVGNPARWRNMALAAVVGVAFSRATTLLA